MGYFGGTWSDMLIRSGISVTLSRKIVEVSPCSKCIFTCSIYTVYDFNDLQKFLDLSSICSFGCEGLEIKKRFFLLLL